MASPPQYGAYGKIPSLGDFFSDGLPHRLTSPLDAFLQSLLTAGSTRFGKDWSSTYLSAPIWRFTLAPGLLGPELVSGIVMASVDRVGRYFPLTLACYLAEETDVAGVHVGGAEAFLALESAALDQLADGSSREDLRRSLGRIEPPRASAAIQTLSIQGVTVLSASADSSLTRALAAASLANQVPKGFSLWSTLLPAGERLMAFDGLPQPCHAALLFAPQDATMAPTAMEDVRDPASV